MIGSDAMHSAAIVRPKVREAYSAAALRPNEPHPFPVGRQFAESLGYPAELLDTLPLTSVEAFAGVSNVSLFAAIPAGASVLDLGCGAGLDSFIAARRAGPTGVVIGVDFSQPMLERAQQSAQRSRVPGVGFCRADAEHLPLPSDSIDVALVNGIFNLNPARSQIFQQLGSVVRSGGAVYAAELVLSGPLPEDQRTSEANWFA